MFMEHRARDRVSPRLDPYLHVGPEVRRILCIREMNSTCPLPVDETQRLKALQSYALLDTPREQCFDDFTMLANSICETPIAAISLIDERRQWFKSVTGFEARQLPRKQAFCAHTILQRELLVVEDTRQDKRFAANPQVTAEPGFRFYAGAPLRDDDGHTLGSLCVIDRKPRRLSKGQRAGLQALAGKVMREIHYRKLVMALDLASKEIAAARGLLPICCHCKDVRGDEDRWETVEKYIARHMETEFSHGICDACMDVHYPEVVERRRERQEAA